MASSDKPITTPPASAQPPPPQPAPDVPAEEAACDTDRQSTPVVGVGTSAGGLEALSQLLRALPTDTGMAFVLVQHLAPTRESMLTEILSRTTAMPVTEASDKSAVVPNHVYVIPPGSDMAISGGVLQVLVREETHSAYRPIDHFFRSLAEDQGHRAIGVILSGTASDGTLGLEEIKAAGGITFAQDDSAQHHGMPRSAVAAGCVDLVLAPDAIAKEIALIARHCYIAADPGTVPEESAVEPDLVKILQLLRNVTGVDFTQYKAQTLQRRITRRMLLRKSESLNAYARFLETNAPEVEALYQDILIRVTGFFRDPEVFDTLKNVMFPRLFEKHATSEPLRVWVAGCSSGEEAYSFAIALTEFLESTRSHVPVQLFATDLSKAGIDKARAAIYSKDVTQGLSPERLRRFFVELDDTYRISKPIRDMCVFSQHNALTDPSFLHIDLVSCRNMLIYLEPVLQERLLGLLHYAMNPEGILVLGSSETIGSHRALFAVEDAKQKIYSRQPVAGNISPGMPVMAMPVTPKVPAPRPAMPAMQDGVDEGDVHREVDRILLAKYAPSGVVIDANLEILHFRGDTSPYLAPAAGRASFQLLKMAREGLSVALRAVIQKAKNDRAPARQEGVRISSDGSNREVSVEVIPLKGSSASEDRFLVLFAATAVTHETTAGKAGPAGSLKAFLRSAFTGKRRAGNDEAPTADAGASGESSQARSVRLAHELSATRESLQSVIEQQDVVNEKLSAANERAQVANEELQSINEELATSQEEIQATNEELSTVNDELNDRNLDVTKINTDLANLIGGVQTPVVMLGQDLRIRRFSPMAEKVLNFIPADIGRPIGDAKLPIAIPELDRLLAEVIHSGSVRECEVQDGKGRWYSVRIRPYRTHENLIDGVVMILVDVDTIKRARAFAESVVATLREPLLVLDSEFRVRMASRAFYETFKMSPAQTENRLLHELGDYQWDIPELRRLLEVVLPQNSFFNGFEVTREFRNIGKKTMLLNARQLILGIDEPRMILLAIEDFTKHRRLEDDLKVRIDDLASVDRSRTEFLSMLAHELRNPLAAIGSGLSILSTPGATEDVLKHARDLAGRQLRTMVRLTDDLLDVSRVARGRIQLQKESVDLIDILKQSIELSQDEIGARGQEFLHDFPPGPVHVQGDVVRLKQVFINLLQNASKYGKENGHIWLSVESTRNRGSREAVVRVRDDGIGIDAEMLPHVFDLFAQADTSLARSQGGLGIGLTLVRSLVEIHGGTVEAHSSGIGQGSEFVVHLPVVSRAEPAAATHHDPEKQGSGSAQAGKTARRILVVDDNADASESLAMVLRLDGHEVTTSHDGKSALEAVRTLAPAVILLDIGLPEIDGYEVARRLREQAGMSGTLIIAVSGYGQEEDRRKSREAGFDHHLTKPVDFSALNVLLRLSRPQMSPGAPPAMGTSADEAADGQPMSENV